MRRQITALAAAGVLAAGLSVAASWPAHAQSGNQFYADGDYLNGWALELGAPVPGGSSTG